MQCRKLQKIALGDLENGAKMGTWVPLPYYSLDQSSWWDEDSNYLPSRTGISEKQYVSTVFYSFDEYCSRKLNEHINDQKAYHWATKNSEKIFKYLRKSRRLDLGWFLMMRWWSWVDHGWSHQPIHRDLGPDRQEDDRRYWDIEFFKWWDDKTLENGLWLLEIGGPLG